MAKQFQAFPLLILLLVLALLSGRTVQAISPAPTPHPYWLFAPGSGPAPGPLAPASGPAPGPLAPGSGPAPGPLAPASGPAPVPPTPQLPPPVAPAPPTGGGGGVPLKGKGGGSSGLSGGQKAGITIGVLAGAGLIGFAAVVYLKRRSNIQRARFGASARNSQL